MVTYLRAHVMLFGFSLSVGLCLCSFSSLLNLVKISEKLSRWERELFFLRKECSWTACKPSLDFRLSFNLAFNGIIMNLIYSTLYQPSSLYSTFSHTKNEDLLYTATTALLILANQEKLDVLRGLACTEEFSSFFLFFSQIMWFVNIQ